MAEINKRSHQTTIFWVVIGVSALVGVICLVSWITVMSGFTELEQRFVARSMVRAQEVVADRINTISIKASDWSRWDDTYAFIQDKNEAYIKSNLTTVMFDELKINAIIFVDLAGEIVHALNYDPDTKKIIPLPEELKQLLFKGSRLLTHKDKDSFVSGLIMVGTKPYLIVSQPIINSESKGPIRGTFLMAAYFGPDEQQRQSKIIGAQIEVRRIIAEAALPPDYVTARVKLLKGQKDVIKPLDDGNIAGYSILNDILGKQVLILKVTMPREIIRFGRRVLGYFILALIVVGLIFGAVVYIPLEREISGRRQVQKQLTELKERFEQTTGQSREIIWEVDAAGLYIYMSQVVKDILGYGREEIVGKKFFYDLHPEEGREAFRQAAFDVFSRRDVFCGLENPLVAKDGRIVWVSTNGFPLIDNEGRLKGYRGTDHDITQRKQAEESLNKVRKELDESQGQLFQTAKLATIGEMATGIAHEINQPLGAISLIATSFRKFIAKKLLTEEKLMAGLKDIEASVRRMDQTINHVRSFARQGTLEIQQFDVAETIESSLSLMGEQLRLHNIEVVRKFESGLPPFKGEPHQIEQVWINFISNARDAMDEKQKLIAEGKLTASGYCKKLEIAVSRHEASSSILVAFADNGIGLTEESARKAFDPFFTTKPVGKGTGLGLSISYGIIDKHKGRMEIEGRKGEGATLKVYLPV